MSGEVDKVVQQDQTAVSPPVAKPPEEGSRDVEMSEAPPAKEPAQPVVAPPVDSAKPVGLGESNAEVAKEPSQEGLKEALAAPDAKPEELKQAETASEPTDPAVPSATVADVVGGVDKAAEVAPGKLPTDPVEAQVGMTEEAEEASAKMLAASLETPSNGDVNANVSESEPPVEATQKDGDDSPVAGEKRKADDSAGANGDASNKKPNIETASDAPTTNGSAASRKPGRPKKEKKAPAPVGKTARRTRSQGAADL